MKKVLSTILNIICIAIIILAVVILFSVVTTPKGQPPQVFGFSGFRVLTGSMEPTVPTDSFVLVKRVDPSVIRENDIISFYSADEMLRGAVNTHRVVEVHNEGGRIWFSTKGDANQIADKVPVESTALIGKVVLVSRLLGVFIRLISNPLIFGAVIVIPLIIVIFMNVRGMAKDVKALVDEEEAEEKRKLAAALEAEKAAAEAEEPAAEAPEPAAETIGPSGPAAEASEPSEDGNAPDGTA